MKKISEKSGQRHCLDFNSTGWPGTEKQSKWGERPKGKGRKKTLAKSSTGDTSDHIGETELKDFERRDEKRGDFSQRGVLSRGAEVSHVSPPQKKNHEVTGTEIE